MNEARSFRIFHGVMRATKTGDAATDIAWALAQALHNLLRQQPSDGTETTLLLRHFIGMVLLVSEREKQRQDHLH